MVRGLDRFKEHFAGYADRYVLIGGTASSLGMEELGSEFRATKDLDLAFSLMEQDPPDLKSLGISRISYAEVLDGLRQFYKLAHH